MVAAMVLAAGFGSRLRSLTDVCAKALLPIGDRPALAHVIEHLREANIFRIVVNAHHRGDDVHTFARTRESPIAISDEKELLGTAGGLAHAAALLGGGDVLVWNADILADVDLRALVAAHETGGAEATLVVRPRGQGEGSVGVDERGRIVRLRQERFSDEVHGGDFVGISIVGTALRARLPEHGCLVGEVWIPILRSGLTLRVFGYDGPWWDIGTPRRYLAANLAWLDTRGVTAWTGNTVTVADGVSLNRAILGDGSVADGSGALTRCVVWPGAHATAPLSQAVVAPGLIVPV